MRNEIKIGLLAIVAIGLAIWGYKFIQGQNLLSRSTTLIAFYPDVGGVAVGTPITINGVGVGTVSEIELALADQLVKLTFELNKGVQVPKTTEAVIVTTSIMGGKVISLQFDRPCSGDDCAESGDIIEGKSLGLLASFLGEGTSTELVKGLQQTINKSIDSLNQSLFGEESNHPIAASSRDLRATMANLKSSTAELDQLLQRSSGDINGTLDNLNNLSETLDQQGGAIANILQNTDTVTQALVEADIEARLQEVSASINALEGTLKTADQALGDISTLIGEIKEGDGTLHNLIYDEQLYRRLNSLTYTADTLFEDIQGRPYRYVPFKSRRKVKKFDRKDEAQKEQ